nr:MAG TPA: hypothetical protein [Caudoviricetes sp.]
MHFYLSLKRQIIIHQSISTQSVYCFSQPVNLFIFLSYYPSYVGGYMLNAMIERQAPFLAIP